MYSDVDEKKCFKCNEYKSYSEFYKHNGMADGFLNKCKCCTKKDAIKNRNDNIDYYREYDKQRANIPKRVLSRELYAKTKEGIESAIKAKRKWTQNNLIKKAASVMVNNAIRDKKIIKKYVCESCSIKDVVIHGHHDDYAKPLEVRWLCSKCHRNWHKIHGQGLNSE